MEKMVRNKESIIRWLMILFCVLNALYYIINAFTDGTLLASVYEYVDVDVTGNGYGVPDGLTDYVNSVKESYAEPYKDCGVIYPPVASLIYKILGEMVPSNIRPADGRSMMHWLVQMIVFATVCIMGIAFSIRKALKEYRLSSANLVIAALLISAPMIFALERGNIILLTVAFSLFFVAHYESEVRLLRELSYISLALAFSIKLYPAIFGILLIRKKDYSGIIKSAVYGALSILLPFLTYYVLDDMKLWITNLTAVSSSIDDWGYAYNLSLYSITKVIFYLTGIEFGERKWLVFRILVFGGLAIALFFSKKKQNVLLAATLLLILVPNASYYYVALFLWIPMQEFIKRRNEMMDGNELISVILMLLIMVPLALPRIERIWWGQFRMTYTYLVYDLAVLALVVISVLVAIKDVSYLIKERRSYVRE